MWQETMVYSNLATCEKDEEMMERVREGGGRRGERAGREAGGGVA